MSGMGYPSDVSDAEWEVIAPLLAAAKPGGRPRTTPLRAVVNAIFYVSRGGVAWRMLPRDFPPYQTTYRYFRAWSKDGTWEKVHEVLRDRVRQKEGREASPSAAIIDSQSAKTTEKGAPEGTTRAENQRAQAAYPRRHARLDPGVRSSPRRYPGSGRRQTASRKAG
jgi:transposase